MNMFSPALFFCFYRKLDVSTHKIVEMQKLQIAYFSTKAYEYTPKLKSHKI